MRSQDVPQEENSLDDPEWYRNMDVPGIQSDGHDMGSSTPALRTLGGGLDFLHGIEHELRDWWEHEVHEGRSPEDQLPQWIREKLPYRPNKIEVTADNNPSASFHCQTFTIPSQANQIQAVLVSARSDRIRAVLLNTGANPAFYGHQDDPNFSSPNNASQDYCLLPINGTLAREVRARGRIYVYSPLGTTVDIQEEYGFADRLKP